jgi:hypothetical protein
MADRDHDELLHTLGHETGEQPREDRSPVVTDHHGALDL